MNSNTLQDLTPTQKIVYWYIAATEPQHTNGARLEQELGIAQGSATLKTLLSLGLVVKTQSPISYCYSYSVKTYTPPPAAPSTTEEDAHGPRSAKNGTYVTWYNMMARCYNKNANNYKYYGGRGIEVCDSWHDFTNFAIDMGDRPPGLQLDREDNDGDYEPSNCRWVTRSENMRNTRANRRVTIKGVEDTVAGHAETHDIPYDRLHDRVARGIEGEELLKPTVLPYEVSPGVIEEHTLDGWEKRLGFTKDFLGSRIRRGFTLKEAIETPKYHRPERML